jgi:molybdopterin-dependent oxidoreductase alpha subunit
MNKPSKDKPAFATSEKLTGIRVSSPQNIAGGIPAIWNSAKHILGETGLKAGISTLLAVNQFDGFDCPGCAWPDPEEKRSSIGEFCENGAKAIAEEVTLARVDEDFFKKFSVSELASKSDYWIGKSGRLTRPFWKPANENHYQPISWEEAFQKIGGHLDKLNDPNEAVFYTSGRTSNEAAFLYQLMVRLYGTNNLPDCSNMCHESSGVALSETLGIGKGSVTLDDFENTELIIILGQNPGTNHPRMLTALQKAKNKGAKIITINPIREAGLLNFRHPQHTKDIMGQPTSITDLYLQVRINEDVALLKSIMIRLFQIEKISGKILDHEFIENHTTGFDDFKTKLLNEEVDILIERSGISPEDINEAAKLIASSKKIICCWAMGLTQHQNAVDNIREVVNLLLLKGSIGKPGTGTCPVRGHSNVQGDRTMGIWENPSSEFLDRLGSYFDFEPPRLRGFNAVESIEAMNQGKVKVFVAMGGNFLMAAPDTKITANGLTKCDLTVQISTKLNRSHLVTGKEALILPCLGRTEKDLQAEGLQFVTVENSAGIVHKSTGRKAPASPNLKSEPEIVVQLAIATRRTSNKINWAELISNYDRIREAIAGVVPGCENYNQKVRKEGGFYLPNGARERNFKTKTGKANFTLNEMPNVKRLPDELMMMTIRSHDQFNTTLYGLNDRYRGIKNERRVVFMNVADMKDRNIAKEDIVILESNYNNTIRKAENFIAIPYSIPEGCVATYFPEANALVPLSHKARGSDTPASKSVVIKIKRFRP